MSQGPQDSACLSSTAAGLPDWTGARGFWRAPFGAGDLLCGPGTLAEVGEIAIALGGRRALLVSDKGVVAAGHAGRAHHSLTQAGLACLLFDAIEENPTTGHVEAGAAAARAAGIDLIVAVGGGSAMDTARGINFLLTNGGKMEDYRGWNLALRPMLTSIGAPTTAGTGSEAQSYAVIEQEGTRQKMACGDEKARFRSVILDPEITASMPSAVAGRSAMDAISHVVESYVCLKANPTSRLYGQTAWRHLSLGFSEAISPKPGVQCRGRMLLGAYLAGAAVEASMLGAAHACANPLTSRYGIPHGAAVLLTLPHVVRFNTVAAGPLYAELLGQESPDPAPSAPLPERLEEMRAAAAMPESLAACGIPRKELPILAREAATQWTLRFNPRPAGEADLLRFYEAAW